MKEITLKKTSATQRLEYQTNKEVSIPELNIYH